MRLPVEIMPGRDHPGGKGDDMPVDLGPELAEEDVSPGWDHPRQEEDDGLGLAPCHHFPVHLFFVDLRVGSPYDREPVPPKNYCFCSITYIVENIVSELDLYSID
jgi:hypothetical protein